MRGIVNYTHCSYATYSSATILDDVTAELADETTYDCATVGPLEDETMVFRC